MLVGQGICGASVRIVHHVGLIRGVIMHSGTCLCGAIQFTVQGDLPAPNACHCTQCRKMSGHYWASVDIARDRLRIADDSAVRWYQSSAKVRRGFCANCGSFLFWDPLSGGATAVAMGAFDGPTRTRLARHIFTADRGDYYDITDDLPQNRQ